MEVYYIYLIVVVQLITPFLFIPFIGEDGCIMYYISLQCTDHNYGIMISDLITTEMYEIYIILTTNRC